jgi:hypothetical protein
MVPLALLVAVVAAARSTWSPCGLSMLSSITPFGERSRGHRYGFTAAWFIAGAVAGGATLGAGAAGLAVAVRACDATRHRSMVIALVAVVGAAVDAGLFGQVLPLVRRQVDDRWMSRYRRWVYASGFGWQIGVGLATYVMTAAVFLVVVMAALTGSPLAAVLLCAFFGLVRGSTVLLTAGATGPARLRALHRGLERVAPAVWVSAVAGQLVVALTAAAWIGAGAAALVAGAVMVGAAVRFLPMLVRSTR